MRIASRAKINYVLDVLRRRSDGYHEIATIFLPLTLHDVVEVRAAPGDGIELHCDNAAVPRDERNTAYRAARALLEHTRTRAHIVITIAKCIPLAGGLGGSATNGAAVLRALNAELSLGLRDDELMALATGIGADVPFFLLNHPALATGIGEVLHPVKAPALDLVIVEPACAYFEGRHKTRELYTLLDNERYEHLDIDAALAALRAGGLEAIARRAGNVFEAVAFKAQPALAALKQRLLAQGALYAGLAGAGPCLWALTRSAAQARGIASALAHTPGVRRAFATRTLPSA